MKKLYLVAVATLLMGSFSFADNDGKANGGPSHAPLSYLNDIDDDVDIKILVNEGNETFAREFIKKYKIKRSYEIQTKAFEQTPEINCEFKASGNTLKKFTLKDIYEHLDYIKNTADNS